MPESARPPARAARERCEGSARVDRDRHDNIGDGLTAKASARFLAHRKLQDTRRARGAGATAGPNAEEIASFVSSTPARRRYR